jgi:mannitol-1-phosphate/altronate dehydrogenase
MNHFSWDQVPQLLAAIVAAVSAFVAAWKSHQTARDVRAMEQRQFADILARKRPQAPPEEVPAASISINDVFRYWDLASKVAAAVVTVKTLPPHVAGSLGIIKAKLNGRHAVIGPVPIEFED